MRLDLYISENGMTSSRSRAANLIALGRVKVNGATVCKASYEVKTCDEVALENDYEASLGGMKLTRAIEGFSVSVEGKTCLDVGASNGGFTDVLLKNGAKKVYALDVGECALPLRLINDDRVVVMDRTNARFIAGEDFPETPALAVIDVSFISLTAVLAPTANCLADDGEIIALIKPQFECTKRDLSKRGILLDPKKRLAAVKKIESFCISLGLEVRGVTEAPHPFEEKNQEYLIHIKKKPIIIA